MVATPLDPKHLLAPGTARRKRGEGRHRAASLAAVACVFAFGLGIGFSMAKNSTSTTKQQPAADAIYKTPVTTEDMRSPDNHSDRNIRMKSDATDIETKLAQPNKPAIPSCGPAIIGIGVQKGGTTTFWYHFRATFGKYFAIPSAGVSKELHFFDKQYNLYPTTEARVDAYLANFQVTKEKKAGSIPCMSAAGIRYRPNDNRLFVDITPSYIYDPLVPPRIKEIVPDATFVIILRHPVARALSAMNMDFRFGKIGGKDAPSDISIAREYINSGLSSVKECFKTHQDKDLAAAILTCYGGDLRSHPTVKFRADKADTIWRGIYVEQLKVWFSYFPKSQIKIWHADDFYADQPGHYNELFDDMGLDPVLKTVKHKIPKRPRTHADEVPAEAIEDLVEEMYEFYAPYNKQLYKYLAEQGFEKTAMQLERSFEKPRNTSYVETTPKSKTGKTVR